MKLLARAKHKIIKFCTRKKPVHSQNQSGSWQMTPDIGVCQWPKLTSLRVQDLSLSLHRHLQESSQRLKASQAQWHEGAGQPKICVSHFSKVSPFATKITINQISSNIKPNQVKPAWNWNQLKSCGYICQVPGAPRCIYMLHVAIVGKTQGTNQILPRKAGSTTTHRETGSSGGLWGEAPGTEWGERRYAKELPSCNQRNSIEKYVCCNVLYII